MHSFDNYIYGPKGRELTVYKNNILGCYSDLEKEIIRIYDI